MSLKPPEKVPFLGLWPEACRANIPDADALISYVNAYLSKEKTLRFSGRIKRQVGTKPGTLRLYNASLFITGSNSKLLPWIYEELSGRYVSFRIRPFVYRENPKNMLTSWAAVWAHWLPGLGRIPGCVGAAGWNPHWDTWTTWTTPSSTTIWKKPIQYSKKRCIWANRRLHSCLQCQDFQCKIHFRLYGQNISISVPAVIKYLGYLKEAYVIEESPFTLLRPRQNSITTISFMMKMFLWTASEYQEAGTTLHTIWKNIVLNELLYLGYEVSVYSNKGRSELSETVSSTWYRLHIV